VENLLLASALSLFSTTLSVHLHPSPPRVAPFNYNH
jgi:hypothetical protein